MKKETIIISSLILIGIFGFFLVGNGIMGMVAIDSGIKDESNKSYYLQIGIGTIILMITALIAHLYINHYNIFMRFKSLEDVKRYLKLLEKMGKNKKIKKSRLSLRKLFKH